ncbi:LysR family transcriptional regulator [[Clostridium] symbiosum]|uniref:LysR family transcriptional regulator n=1 Tax=Clostridium symbiosum TaxID=1512 RepID=UPI001D06FE93|nr:LysR family transcriptional regulator [[Clostridium] symbiosum]MCB6607819.1 LysR family transcriptional regulator [[Clostridium] symbiosum]MCB6932680.1 LysR family transcriptional regulator [[Clostridium] symbiosum]
MDINYELYKVFYHVASTLSFSEASKQLFISQSAVSQSIKVLEKKLNQTLFIRSTKRVQLTPEGEILLKHIEPAMNLIKKGENQLLEANTLNGGQLRIGASDTICRYFLVPFLNEFHKMYPNIHIKVTNRTSIECARLLENGQVDFIITNYPNSGLSNTQNIQVIHEFSDVFVANEDYFPLKDRIITLKELQSYPILMLDRKSTTSEFLHSMFQKHQLDLVPEIELSSNDLLIDLAKIGLGIAFVPDFCIPQQDDNFFILNLEEILPRRQLVVVHNETIPISQAARQFIELLEERADAGKEKPIE